MVIPQVQEHFDWGDFITLDRLSFDIEGQLPENFTFMKEDSGLRLITKECSINSEAYNIFIDSEGIKIEYGSKRALFYSIDTLKQLIRYENGTYTISIGVIRDYPVFKMRGIIEGFYGRPWSHEDRLSLL